MNGKNLMRVFLILVSVVVSLFAVSCASSKLPVNEDGVILASSGQMNKDGIRLRGKVQDINVLDERIQYSVQIKEVLSFGSTFSGVQPNVSETVILYASKEMKFKKGAEVIFDALSPIDKGAGVLELNLIEN
ncbi:hypothetical protein AWW68_06735 [Roseivirga spongicola]|jgi:hypothetical protein|uniref:Uncharacterized protein n=2 Tax=Roseivirgaceae TaxID=2762306 RepID=A0A150XIA2_9BACT|nr:hypothetical protein AWW68_06735 [Roseivirga spongicola]